MRPSERVELPNGRLAIVHYLPTLVGMTTHHRTYADVFVPDRDDEYGRTVKRHELLHAEYENPHDSGSARTRSNLIMRDGYSEATVAGVDDAFVQLNYWPQGKDTVADSEAIDVAFDMVKVTDHTMVPAEEDESLSHDRLMMIDIRSLAMLRRLGTAEQYAEIRKLVGKYLSENDIEGMEHVLDLVEAWDREGAYKAFENLLVGDSAHIFRANMDEIEIARMATINPALERMKRAMDEVPVAHWLS